MRKFLAIIFTVTVYSVSSCKRGNKNEAPVVTPVLSDYYSEPYRPQYHFSPKEKWMNDPNGMVYHKGTYHLFYQYYPEDIVWGPMHWGHAVSTDLVHWQHKPIALYPDQLGYIFSGSAVVDTQNTSGFGTLDNPPLVAIFTYHSMEGEKAGRTDFQTQGIAYSVDNGDTWVKYEANPVIGNEGIKDFRDPKVMWHAPSEQWVLTLVAGDHAKFYGSKNLKDWQLMGEFGKEHGAHGGVWECPDLIKMTVKETGEEKWVLLISINPGAPNGGSGTQYFVGGFDGKTFTTDQTETKWVDHGTDNYAGVTYNNAPGDAPIFIGWMSNWAYARDTPTEKWRSANTLPRKLSLQMVNGDYELFNYPVESLATLAEVNATRDLEIGASAKDSLTFAHLNQSRIRFTTNAKDFKITFGNSVGDALALTAKGEENVFLLDRTRSGKVDFQTDFGKVAQRMPIPNLPDGDYEVVIYIDQSSIEIFIGQGQYVMTAQVFPNAPYTDLHIENMGTQPLGLRNFSVDPMRKVW